MARGTGKALAWVAIVLAAGAVGGGIVYVVMGGAPRIAAPSDAISETAAAPETSVVPSEGAALDSEPEAPRIDLLRVEPSGQALLAGRGAPGWEIDILLDRIVLAAVTAETDGTFTEFFQIAPSDIPRSVSLVMRSGDVEIASEDVMIIAPAQLLAAAPALPDPVSEEQAIAGTDDLAEPTSEADDAGAGLAQSTPVELPETIPEDVAEADPEPAPNPAEEEAVAALSPEFDAAAGQGRSEPPELVASEVASELSDNTGLVAQTPSAPDPVESAVPHAPVEAAQAPVILRADAEGVQVLQAPGAAGPVTEVALDTISYDAAGAVSLAGRGTSEFVRVYLDNRPLTTAPVEPGGAWRVALPEVDQGVYTLRIDAVEADGRVSSRVETPFLREGKALLAASDPGAGSGAPLARVVTVQPGNTLWALARDRYGEGTLYVRIFEANRETIRDPDLIYPGQVFDLPEE